VLKHLLIIALIAGLAFSCAEQREETDNLEVASPEVTLAAAPAELSEAAAKVAELSGAKATQKDNEWIVKIDLKAVEGFSASEVFVIYDITRQAEGRKITVFPQTFVKAQGPLEAGAAFSVEIAVGRSGLPGPRTVNILNITETNPVP